ncbi:MAG: 3-deoxy-D-manno-octulosonic acid transferase, partial [Terriglobales bacterium]
LLAPRHPQRFEAVAALVAARGLPLTRRSRLSKERLTAGGVVLLDSLGELASTYQAAAVAFIGGSLVPSGGHNLLEAAYWGVPVLVGPHTENFALITEQFVAAGAARVVGSGIELTRVWLELLADAGGRERMGGTARALLASQRGATERALDAIAAALGPAGAGAAATMEADARSH